MRARLICLVRRHQWHNGWDEERHEVVWTCKRCGAPSATSGETPARWIPSANGMGDVGGGDAG
jgi:hypothetical protein